MTARPKVTEAQFQEQVCSLAVSLGLRFMHVRRSKVRQDRWATATNIPWPDLVLFGPGVFLIRELKVRNVFQPGQREVLGELVQAGVDAGVWMPKDLDSGRIYTEMRGRTWEEAA